MLCLVSAFGVWLWRSKVLVSFPTTTTTTQNHFCNCRFCCLICCCSLKSLQMLQNRLRLNNNNSNNSNILKIASCWFSQANKKSKWLACPSSSAMRFTWGLFTHPKIRRGQRGFLPASRLACHPCGPRGRSCP